MTELANFSSGSVVTTGKSHEDCYRALFSAVVLAALDDAITDERKYGNGVESIARWAKSRDGREVLDCAGIVTGERTAEGLANFVRQGVRTSVALSREEIKRQEEPEVEYL